MCRGHSENGTWHDAGVKKCHSAFLEAYTFSDDQVLNALGLRHLSMETHLVRANVGSELYQRHKRMTRCLPCVCVPHRHILLTCTFSREQPRPFL